VFLQKMTLDFQEVTASQTPFAERRRLVGFRKLEFTRRREFLSFPFTLSVSPPSNPSKLSPPFST
jgi:hypothetical protein